MPHIHTVILAVSAGFPARNLLRSSFFDSLKKMNFRIVILSPNYDEPYFVKEFEDENVILLDLRKKDYDVMFESSPIQRWMRLARLYSGPDTEDLGTLDGRLELFIEHSLSKRNWLIRSLFSGIVRGLRHSKLLRRGWLVIESALFTPHLHRRTFEEFRPDLLITASTGGHWHGDAYLIREAHRAKVKSVCIVQSWDNPSSYGMEGARADLYIVWAEQMKRDLMAFQEVPFSKIFVGGAPIFSIYKKLEALPTRQEFFAHWGLDPKRKLIVYGTISPKDWHPYDIVVVEFLLESISQSRIKESPQLIVRFHPRAIVSGHGLDAYQSLQSRYPDLRLSIPQVLSERLVLDMPTEEQGQIAGLVLHADVLVNVWSTLSLEAALCNTPIINIAFDPAPEHNKNKRALLEQRPDHMMMRPHIKRLVNSNGSRLAYSWEELNNCINEYLDNPQLDTEARERLAVQEIGPLDSSTGTYISESLSRYIETGILPTGK